MDNPNCTKCGILPDDLLMMSCSHDLCLNCASKRLTQNKQKPKTYKDILICQQCYVQTTLQPQSIIQLAKILNQNINSSLKDNTSSRVNFNVNEKNSQSRSSLDIVSKNGLCSQHPQQYITYFCFDCKCECICAQCIIHGVHKDHDVKTIRKTFPIIKEQLQKKINHVEKLISKIQKQKKIIQHELINSGQDLINAKSIIKKIFKKIRQQLNLKQALVLEECDKIMKNKNQHLNIQLKDLKNKMNQFKQRQRKIRNLYNHQQVKLINYYAQNYVKLNEIQKQEGQKLNKEVANGASKIKVIGEVLEQIERYINLIDVTTVIKLDFINFQSHDQK